MDPRHYYCAVHLAVDSPTRSSLVLLKIDYSLLIGGLYNTILMRRDQIVGAYTACRHVMSANTVAGRIFTSSLIARERAMILLHWIRIHPIQVKIE